MDIIYNDLMVYAINCLIFSSSSSIFVYFVIFCIQKGSMERERKSWVYVYSKPSWVTEAGGCVPTPLSLSLSVRSSLPDRYHPSWPPAPCPALSPYCESCARPWWSWGASAAVTGARIVACTCGRACWVGPRGGAAVRGGWWEPRMRSSSSRVLASFYT